MRTLLIWFSYLDIHGVGSNWPGRVRMESRDDSHRAGFVVSADEMQVKKMSALHVVAYDGGLKVARVGTCYASGCLIGTCLQPGVTRDSSRFQPCVDLV